MVSIYRDDFPSYVYLRRYSMFIWMFLDFPICPMICADVRMSFQVFPQFLSMMFPMLWITKRMVETLEIMGYVPLITR